METQCEVWLLGLLLLPFFIDECITAADIACTACVLYVCLMLTSLMVLQGSEAAAWAQVLPPRPALQGSRMELRRHHQGELFHCVVSSVLTSC